MKTSYGSTLMDISFENARAIYGWLSIFWRKIIFDLIWSVILFDIVSNSLINYNHPIIFFSKTNQDKI